MDKPYTTVQRDDYQLTIYSGTAPLDPNNDNVDVQVTFPNGGSFSAVFFTLQNIDTLMKHYKKTGECADGSYFWASNTISKSLYCINRNVHPDPVGAVS